MPDKYIIQRRTASGLETVAELPALENGKVDLSWLPVVGAMGSAIIERGSNANGEYVRWADGTQVCWGKFPYSCNTVDVFQSITITFPAIFANNNVSGGAYFQSAPGKMMIPTNWYTTTTTVNIYFYGAEGAPTSTNTLNIRWFAIGRWK